MRRRPEARVDLSDFLLVLFDFTHGAAPPLSCAIGMPPQIYRSQILFLKNILYMNQIQMLI